MKPPAKKLNGDDFSCNGDLVSQRFEGDEWKLTISRHVRCTYTPLRLPTTTAESSHQPHQDM